MDKHEVVFRFLSEPADVNFGGKVHGGAVMKWIDQAAFTCAVNWSSQYSVTVYVGGIRFLHPIHIGDIVELSARILYTGRSSMHIGVEINAINPRTKVVTKTTNCIIVFVAVDENGKSVPVPQWVPQTEIEKKREEFAKKMMEMRKEINEAMDQFGNTL
jgi:acyl-CoA hydrolase